MTLYGIMGARTEAEISSYEGKPHFHLSRERLDDPPYRKKMTGLVKPMYRKGEITGEEYRRYMDELKPE